MADNHDPLKQLQESVDLLAQHLAPLPEQVAELRSHVTEQVDELRAQVSELHTEVGDVRGDVASLRGEIGARACDGAEAAPSRVIEPDPLDSRVRKRDGRHAGRRSERWAARSSRPRIYTHVVADEKELDYPALLD